MNRNAVTVRPDEFCRKPPESAPVLIEIGFGNGDFLVHLAKKRADATVYGIEVSHTCIEKALSRTKQNGLTNVRLMCGDARFLLRECFADCEAERIYMSFPCPWPKEKHARRRVTAKGFSDALASVLQIGGIFEMATDEGWYADEVEKILGSHPALRLAERKLNHRREITTKYERKWLDMGKDIHHLYIEKTSAYSAARLVERNDEGMHVRIAPAIGVTPETLTSRVTGTHGSAEKGGTESHWAFRGSFAAPDGTLLEETITTDDGFEQKFYLKIVNRAECTLVKLDGVHLPYLTPAVRSAINDLAAKIQAKDGRAN